MRLSDVGLRALPAPQKGTVDYWDATLPCFGLRVSRGGAKTFILKLHNSRRAIGRFPLLTLSEARTEAKRLLAEKTLGKVRPQSITFPLAVELFLKEKAKARRPSTVADLRDRLKRHFPFRGQLADVSHQEFVRTLSKIKTPREHNHALRVGKTFFTWAVNRRYISENPTIGISTHSTQSRSRVLSDIELAAVWRAADQMGGHFGMIVKLLVLTGQRRGEIAALQSSWIKDDTLTIPPSVTKNGREHHLPLGALSAELLSQAMTNTRTTNGYIFSARTNTGGCFNGWSKAKVALDKASGVSDWTLHDLRRTFASNLAALGVRLEVVEKLLNHVSGSFSGIVGVYQHYSFANEMQQAIEQWEHHVLKITGI